MNISLTAELCAIGDAQESDFEELPPETPRAMFVRDGRPLMLIGLTREECRALAGALFGDFTIDIGSAG